MIIRRNNYNASELEYCFFDTLIFLTILTQKFKNRFYFNRSEKNYTTFKGDIKLSPNPSSEYASLDFELLEDSELTVVVADMYGRIVKSPTSQQIYKAGANNIRFTTSELNEGVYVIAISSKSEKKSLQLIVKH